ncbi:MAG: 3-methyl-2-oxobutanoate hydroxymethyltransferase [Candidatus Omnitrophica bacterium]|nr:3-methyl-2-oxobutanoate hydroxymethyltransferase [Candidatus Omnitrophota bacterium]
MSITPDHIKQKKGKQKIIALTAYDYSFAKLLDSAGVDIILIGDSVGMVCCGDKDTKSVTIEQMVYHTRAVARGVKKALVVGDMPIGTYETAESAIQNAQKLLDAGAQAVKIEEFPGVLPSVEALVKKGIPVMGHVGLTPQTAQAFKVQGKDNETAEKIMSDASALSEVGVFSIVLECIPTPLAALITKTVAAPTIGIGAGSSCDGQILVSYDLLGMFPDFRPKFVRQFFHGDEVIKRAVEAFRQAIETGNFPSHDESFS